MSGMNTDYDRDDMQQPTWRCLVVEDEPAARKLLQMYLKKVMDYEEVTNGADAVEAVKRAYEEGRPYDLVCMDIDMPEKNGPEALKEIREMEEERGVKGLDVTKVIMTTVHDDPRNIMGAFRTGCEGYLVKPIKRHRLYEQLEKLGLGISEDSRV